MATIIEVESGNQNATEFLEPYIQSGSLNFLLGSGASFPAVKTAGNIEAELNALIHQGQHEIANGKSHEFISAIVEVHDLLLNGFADAETVKVGAAYEKFATLVDGILFARKSLLLPRQATVFTTNYDLFLEHAAAQLPGLLLNDGFDRSAGLNSAFAFSPERYFDRTYRSSAIYGRSTEIPTINLVKLHGSLSWHNADGRVVYRNEFEPKLSALEADNADKVATYLANHFLILPNVRKFHETLMDRVYYDLLRLFSKAMEQENAILIAFGFSFGDEHILDITRRSLRNPTAQLVVVSYDKASAASYEAKFTNHRNVTILAPPAGSQIDFTRLNEMLQAVLAEVPT